MKFQKHKSGIDIFATVARALASLFHSPPRSRWMSPSMGAAAGPTPRGLYQTTCHLRSTEIARWTCSGGATSWKREVCTPSSTFISQIDRALTACLINLAVANGARPGCRRPDLEQAGTVPPGILNTKFHGRQLHGKTVSLAPAIGASELLRIAPCASPCLCRMRQNKLCLERLRGSRSGRKG